MTRASVACALAVLLASCAVAREPGEKTVDDYGSTNVPALDARKTPKPGATSHRPIPNSSKNLKGTIAVTVSAPNGDLLPGVTIAYKGPERGTMKTDARGRATQDVKPGAYALDVQTCGDEIYVTYPQGADLTVIAGQTTPGDIPGNGWEPRFAPTGEVAATTPPPWHIGVAFTLKSRVGDRCRDSAPVNDRIELENWQYEVTDPVQLFATPSMRTDRKGWLAARFVCNANGDGAVSLRDPRVGTRFVHILAAVPHPENATYCIS